VYSVIFNSDLGVNDKITGVLKDGKKGLAKGVDVLYSLCKAGAFAGFLRLVSCREE